MIFRHGCINYNMIKKYVIPGTSLQSSSQDSELTMQGSRVQSLVGNTTGRMDQKRKYMIPTATANTIVVCYPILSWISMSV